MKWLPMLCFCLIFFLGIFFWNPVYAQEPATTSESRFEAQYQTYINQYDVYRKAHDEFVKKRNLYRTYGTLQSQLDVVAAAKALLDERANVILTYNDLLFTRNVDAALSDVLFSEKIFFQTHQDKIPAISSVEDALLVSKEFEDHIVIYSNLTYQILANILLAKVDALETEITDFEDTMTTFTISLREQGFSVEKLERGLVESQNKLLLARQNLNQAKTQIANLSQPKRGAAQKVDNLQNYTQARFILFSTNQYLRETTDIFAQLLEEIKYGAY